MANPPINPKNKRISESEQETRSLVKHNLKELQLLSVLADNRKGLLEVSSIVKPEDFETNEYRETYIAFLNNDKDLDDYLRNIIDYQEQQRTRELQRSTGQTLKDYAKKVKEHSVRRKVNSVLRRARHKVLNTDSEMLLSSLQSNLFSISGEVTGERICSSKDIVKKAITEMNDFSKEKKKIELPSNFSNLGDIVKGIFPHHIWIIGGHSGTGKSFFTLQLISDLMLSSGDKENPSNLKIVIFSTENNATDNLFRIVGCRTGIPFIDIKTNNLSENDKVRVNKHFEILKKTSLWIYDNVYDVTQLASIVALHRFRGECDLVVIDYIQNLNMWEKDSYVQMNKVAMTLQQMALTNDVATICVSQLSNTESRESGDKMITFKGAGEIKAIADVGIWLQKGISENIKNKYKEQYGEGVGNPLMETEASTSNMLRYVEKENEDLITAYVNKVRHAMPGTAVFEFFTNQCLMERHQYLNKIDFKISDEDAPDLANALG